MPKPDRDVELADRAIRERWDLRRLMEELRSTSPATFSPKPKPPPTRAAAGTPEKIEVMLRRREQGFAVTSDADPRLDGRMLEALTATRNMNGSDTEREAVDVRGFVCERDWKRALVEIDQAKISEAQKEMLADEVLARADPDYEMTKRLQRIDELLLVVRRKP
jgi:hypothetical protein